MLKVFALDAATSKEAHFVIIFRGRAKVRLFHKRARKPLGGFIGLGQHGNDGVRRPVAGIPATGGDSFTREFGTEFVNIGVGILFQARGNGAFNGGDFHAGSQTTIIEKLLCFLGNKEGQPEDQRE